MKLRALLSEAVEEILLEKKLQPIDSKILMKKLQALWDSIPKQNDDLSMKMFNRSDTPYTIDLWFLMNGQNRSGRDDLLPEQQEFLEKAKSLVKARGWQVVAISASLVTLEANYGIRIADIPAKIFHLTPTKNAQNIAKNGLRARRGKYTGYEPRIYFGRDVEDCWRGLPPSQVAAGNTIALLTIDTAKLNKGTKIFVDTDQGAEGHAMWTYSNIPPQAITIEIIDNPYQEQALEDIEYTE